MVPGSLGLGSAVLAAMATLAPSAAQRLTIASPMPREAPEMKMVLPLRLVALMPSLPRQHAASGPASLRLLLVFVVQPRDARHGDLDDGIGQPLGHARIQRRGRMKTVLA